MTELQQLTQVPCPLCRSSDSRHLFWTRDYVFQVSDLRFGVRRCNVCGAGFASPRPLEQDIGHYYPKAFYWAWEGAERELDWSEIIKSREAQLQEKATWLQDLPPGRLLDIGAQKGEFLWFMAQRGWTAEGVEMDSKVPNPGALPIRYGDFLAMDFPKQSFDVVTLWAVLEHVYDPLLFIEKATRLLKPGGRLIVLVTNMNSIQSRYYQADDYPRHLTLFTKASIRKMCRSQGLDLERVATDQKIFGGSLAGGLVYAVKRLFGYRQEEAFAEWKQLEDAQLFWTKWRGSPSRAVKMVSRLDRLLTLPFEWLLDRLGYGFILTFRAQKTASEAEHG